MGEKVVISSSAEVYVAGKGGPALAFDCTHFKFKLIVQMVNVKVKIIAEETIAMVASERICKAI